MGYYKMGILPNCFLLLLGEAFNYSLTNYDSPGKFIDYKGNKNKACFLKKRLNYLCKCILGCIKELKN